MAKTELFILSIVEEDTKIPVPLNIIMEVTMTLTRAIDNTQWLKFKYPFYPLLPDETAMRFIETKLGCDIPLDDATNPNGIVIGTVSYKIEDDSKSEGYILVEEKVRLRIQDNGRHEL